MLESIENEALAKDRLVNASIPSDKWTPETVAILIENGNSAQNVMNTRDVGIMWYLYKTQLSKNIANVRGHDEVANNTRIALSNQLACIEGFAAFLHQAVELGAKARSKTMGVPPSDEKRDISKASDVMPILHKRK